MGSPMKDLVLGPVSGDSLRRMAATGMLSSEMRERLDTLNIWEWVRNG